MSKKLLELNMSNKKNHKVMITDVAIKKVPKICFEYIPENEHDIICGFAKKVLEFSKKRNDSNEVSITYLLGSKTSVDNIGIQFGNETEVDPLSNTTSYHMIMGQKECAVVILHNHPSMTSFSLEDIRFFLEYRTIKLLVVVTNRGTLHYIVKSDKYNSENSILLFNKSATEFNKSKNVTKQISATQKFLKKCKKCGIIYKKH